MATPVLALLRHYWPRAHLAALCQGAIADLLKHDPHLDQIISITRTQCRRGGNSLLRRTLSHSPYDLGVLLTHSFSSAWLLWRCGVKWRLGYAVHGRRFFLNLPVSLPKGALHQHLVETYQQLLSPIGIYSSPPLPPSLYLKEEEHQLAKTRLQELGLSPHDILIGINPGAAYGPAKCWPISSFIQLHDLLLRIPEVRLLYIGDQAGMSRVQEICRVCPHRAIDLSGKTSLRELMAVVASCQLFVTNDSGPLHIASALGIPIVALFGSTDPRVTGPYQGGAVVRNPVSCSPCFRRECPIDFKCMEQLSVATVAEAVMRQLNRPLLERP